MNYFNLIENIKEVSLGYVEEFFEGDIYEFLNNGTHKYPSMILTIQNIDTSNLNTISATLFCVERLTDSGDNKTEAQSLCMTNILKVMQKLEENFDITQSTFTPFTEKFSDLCAGMYVEFTLSYMGENVCDEEETIRTLVITEIGIYDVSKFDRVEIKI